MTTVIMISNDNSVIITNSDTSDTVTPVKTMSPDSGAGSSGDSPDFRGHVTKPGPIRAKSHHQSRKLSLSTVESDSEELNNSSSSTTSTLSSRTSGVSSGATSGSSGSNLSYWHQPLATPSHNQTGQHMYMVPEQRKFTNTLNRSQTKNKSNPIMRTRSFQVPQNLSQFSPSENSAFHCISSSNSKDMSQFQAAKFVTSTPVKAYKDSSVRHRRPQQYKNVLSPMVTGSPGHSGHSGHSAGPVTPLSTFTPGGESLDRPHTSDYYSATRSLGRKTRGYVASTRDPDISQHPAFRHLMPPPSVSLSSNMKMRTSRYDEGPINNNYTRIYSAGLERRGYGENNNNDDLCEIYRDPVSSDSDYDTIYSNKEDNNTLLPIGSVFPSGCHRHPSKLMPHRPTHDYKSSSGHYPQPQHTMMSSSNSAHLLSYRHNLDLCHSENSTLNKLDINHRKSQHYYPSLSENSSESDSISRKDRPRLLPDFINKSDLAAAKAKSFDGLAALLNKTSFKENKENNKSKISFNDSIVPRRQKLKISQPTTGGNKFGGLSVSKAQILRRHTLHDKSNIRQSLHSGHVHSWHKSEEEQQRSKSSSLKRTVSRRSSSSSRLSLLSRKDDVEISITDSQSLDRLSLHSQEDLDDINIEKYLQTAGRAAGWAKDFDCLLSDKVGLGKFTEFLQKEFSHENIFFWCSCEKYRLLETGEERLKLAQDIIQRHLELGAVEPVNVDSVARAATRHKVAMSSVTLPPENNVFLSAQRQIYNLMKFDSYPRFLKSDVYKDCIRAEMSGSQSTSSVSQLSLATPDTNRDASLRQRRTDSLKTKRRKSMSFWEHWSKSRDTLDGDTCDNNMTREYNPGGMNVVRGGCTLTRVIFPDHATTVVSTTTGESIRALVSRLLEKRNLRLTSFDVFVTSNEAKPLDLSEDCAILHCTEVRVESRVLFRLELPSHKSIGVKAKQTKTVRDVLAPILQQYGWNINEVDVYVDEDTTIAGVGDDKVDLVSNVGVIDNKRLFVVQKSYEEIQKVENTATAEGSPAAPQAAESDAAEMTLYEGLQIMRKGRFEDQRGTEICFEIPEFLRLPENSEDIQDVARSSASHSIPAAQPV